MIKLQNKTFFYKLRRTSVRLLLNVYNINKGYKIYFFNMELIMNYIYNSWSKKYKSKFGALETGDSCRFSIRLPKGTVIDSNPVLIIFRNGFRERFLTMAKIYTTDEYTEYSTTFV